MEQILGVRQNLTFLGCWWAKDIFRRTVHIVHIVQIVLHNSKNNFQQVVGGAGVTFLLALRITMVGCLKETSWDDFWNSLMFRWRLWGCSRTSNAAAAMRPAVVVNLDARFVSLSVCPFLWEVFRSCLISPWWRRSSYGRWQSLGGCSGKKTPLLLSEVTIKEKQLFAGTGSGQTHFLQS